MKLMVVEFHVLDEKDFDKIIKSHFLFVFAEKKNTVKGKSC